jgi:hypothetical protein
VGITHVNHPSVFREHEGWRVQDNSQGKKEKKDEEKEEEEKVVRQ